MMLRIQVHGESMLPHLCPGDTVIIDEKIAPVVGDIVLGKLNGELTIHRLISNTFVKGDNCKYLDGEIDKDFYVIGVAQKTYRSKWIARLSKFNIQGKLYSKPARCLIMVMGSLLRFFRKEVISEP